MRILKGIGKILAIILLSITGFLLLACLLLRIPSVQQRLVQMATNYVDVKTKGKLKVDGIYLNFPNELKISDVLLKNPKGELLLKAEEIKFDISILPLIHKSFQIGTVKISSLYANIQRKEIDSAYNFQFLIDAFRDTTKTVSVKNKSSINLEINNIHLDNIHFLLDDKFQGTFVDANLKKLDISIQKMNLDSLKFHLGSINLYNSDLTFNLLKSKKKNSTNSTLLPSIIINHLAIKDVKIKYKNFPDSLFYEGDYPHFEINNLSTNLSTNKYSFSDLTINNSRSKINFSKRTSVKSKESVRQTNTPSFQISGNRISLENNNFELQSGKESLLNKKTFTPEHLKFNYFSCDFKNLSVSSNSSKININKLSFLLNDTFALKKISADIHQNENSAIVSHLNIRSAKSEIIGDANFQYSSINSIENNLGSILLELQFKKSIVDLDEVGYFNKAIFDQKKVNLIHKRISLSTQITGKIDDVKIKTLKVSSSPTCQLILNGSIKNLTKPSALIVDFPYINLFSTKKDINSFIRLDTLSKNILIPNSIVLNGSLSGTRTHLNSKLSIGTPIGSVALNSFINFGKDTLYQATILLNEFNISELLPNAKSVGKTTLKVTLDGNSFTKEKLKSNFDVAIKMISINNYMYHDAEIQGEIKDQQIKSKIIVEDTCASLVMDVNYLFKKGQEQGQIDLNLKGINMKALNITKDDLRLAGNLNAKIKGNQLDNLNIDAQLNKFILAKDDKSYTFDSISFDVNNTYKNSEIHFRSPIVDLNYKGSNSFLGIKGSLIHYVNTCYETGISLPYMENQSFLFDASIKNHPSISEIFIPGLISFIPGEIKGEFNSTNHSLKVDFGIKQINYNQQIINNLSFTINGTKNKIESSLSIDSIVTSNLKLKQISFNTSIVDNRAKSTLAVGEKDNQKLNVSTTIESNKLGEHKISFLSPLIIDESEWSIPLENFISINKTITYNMISLSHAEEKIDIASIGNNERSTSIKFDKFDIEHIAKILNQDSSIASGKLNGYLNITHIDSTTTVASDISLSDLAVLNSKIGDLKLTSSTKSNSNSDFHLILTGNGNDVLINGQLGNVNNQLTYAIDGKIKSINAQILNGLSLGALRENQGTISGEFSIKGTSTNPNINGFIAFKNFSTTPSLLNSPIKIDNDRIDIQSSSINFNSFTIKDYKDKTADISGRINFIGLKPDSLNLRINTNKFEVFNTTIKDNDLYFGQLIIGGEVNIKGTPNFPVINANIKLDEGSTFTFIVPEAKLSTDKGEGVVEFKDTSSSNLIMDGKKKVAISKIKGYTINSRIEIDPKATLKILIDPSTGDSLNVKGDATMSFSIDPSGKISLTGIYNLIEGSYVVSLQGLIQKKFKIISGSTIRWNGDPMDAEVSIDAMYTVRTAPIDLVSLQIAGLSEEEKNQYKQRLSFLVNLQLRGQLLKPDITFRIELDEKDKGALGGSIDNKLNLLNADESELNKQVFALLLLNRFVQENPLATGGEGVTSETFARTSVSKFLSSQLNQIANNYVAGVELNFDVQSFEDYSSGTKTGRTQVGVGLKKEFLSDRISVQVGGNVDVEGENTKQNNISELAGDVIIEYKLTKDGRLRFSAFRKNLYADAIEGQIIETGVGLLYNRDFDRWKQFFTNPNKVKLNDHVSQ